MRIEEQIVFSKFPLETSRVFSFQVSAVTVEGQNVGYRLRPDSPFAQTIRKTFLDGIPDNVVSELKVNKSSKQERRILKPKN